MERARAEGSASPRAGHFGISSPVTQPHAVPEWLVSPRSTPTGSKCLSSEPSSPLPLPGLVDMADSISPGSLHRLNVFSHAGSRHVSSEGSAEAAPSRVEEAAEDAQRREVDHQQQQAEAALPKQTVHQVTRMACLDLTAHNYISADVVTIVKILC